LEIENLRLTLPPKTTIIERALFFKFSIFNLKSQIFNAFRKSFGDAKRATQEFIPGGPLSCPATGLFEQGHFFAL
jgi:hypothetical protein